MTNGLIIIGILFVMVLITAFMFTRNGTPVGKPQTAEPQTPAPQPAAAVPPAAAAETAEEKNLRNWLSVLYQDNPFAVGGMIERLRGTGLTPAAVAQAVAGGALDRNHIFAADGQTAADGLKAMAERFRFTPALPETPEDAGGWESLLQNTAAEFDRRNAALYRAQAGGITLLAVVPKRDSEDFETASAQWGLDIRKAV